MKKMKQSAAKKWAIITWIAAAMSTSDSQLFALGNELRGLLSARKTDSLKAIRIAIISFAVAALLFSLISSDQLVLLAWISFAGTAIMGPMVLLGIYAKKPQGGLMIVATALGVVAFVLSEAGILPAEIGPARMDLCLMILLSVLAIINSIVRR